MLFLLGAMLGTYILTLLGLWICKKCHLPIDSNPRKAVFYSAMAVFIFTLTSHNYQDGFGWNYAVGVVYLYCLAFVFWAEQNKQRQKEQS